VALIGVAIGALTGFALNPARDLGPRLFSYLAGWSSNALTGGRAFPYFIIPLVAPIFGACLGAALYRGLTRLPLLPRGPGKKPFSAGIIISSPGRDWAEDELYTRNSGVKK
jgi:glycerol uptake facilitator protein